MFDPSASADRAHRRRLIRSAALCIFALSLGKFGCSPTGQPADHGSGGAPDNGNNSGGDSSGGQTASSGGSLGHGADSSTGGTDGGTGGATASGGAANNVDRSYGHGFIPTGISDTELKAAWAHWKDNHVELCGTNSARVIWDEPTQTVSEGIAYGMISAVGMGDQELFDRLWKYYQDNLDPNGLMHWKRGGCEGSQPDENSNNAATDAELDAAMALIQAECRFDDTAYGAFADDLISKIYEHETTLSDLGSGMRLLKPGDMFGGSDCLNPSYFAPAYYRAYAERPSQSSRKADWLKMADDSYTLLARFAHPETGLVPNWIDEEGNLNPEGPSGCNWYTDPSIYGTDAIRTPWRIAIDYLWFGTAEAKTFLDKITEFVQGEGITTVGRKYELDGTAFGEIHHSIMSVGAFANGAMAYDQATADAFAAEALVLNDHNYFPDSLRMLYLLVLTGRFDACAGKHLPSLAE